jgi:rhodanese-related sulfurtransferase
MKMSRIKGILLAVIVFLGFYAPLTAQTTNPAYRKKLSQLYRRTVPIIEPEALEEELDKGGEIVLLDTRTEREYEVSHLPGARFVNYDKWDATKFEGMNRKTPVVVYCTVGYRSERIGERLQKMGFTNVLNLYGGIFEWKNQGHEVVDPSGNPTEQVHTYNKDWSKWLNTGEKIYK